MATEEMVLAEMRERGMEIILAPGEDAGYMNEQFEIVKAEMERETYEQIKKALNFSLINIQGEELTKIANKLHEYYLSGDEEDEPIIFDNGLPTFFYRDFAITINNATWQFDGEDEYPFSKTDLLEGLLEIDSIQEERG